MSKKPGKVDLLDSNLSMQIKEEIEFLTKFSKKEPELIKRLEERINNLVMSDRNAKNA